MVNKDEYIYIYKKRKLEVKMHHH